ncbi:MAG: GTP cyclohydrolase 1 [Cyclobacteriaceae bacterium]|nr:MAG: GTP cyclohydrolase 1 [Cyclobacteriaceae bacterium]
MKPKETLSSIPGSETVLNEIDNEHIASSTDTPLRADAFDLSDKDKMDKIEHHFREIMNVLGLDLNDDSLQGTPKRVAKMYVKEIFSGLNPDNKPHAKLFDNKFKYNEMLVEKDITFYSNCEHHFVPIIGKAHVGYISSGKVIGLSKINRIVQYFAKRPQVQERLTMQIAEDLKSALNTESVGVVVDATHLCVSSRGVGDTNSTTGTAYFSGLFREPNTRSEFLNFINSQ